MPRARSKPTPLLFYGYSVELIAEWCHVSASTAYLYKIGQRKPSPQALALFQLHRDGRVLTSEFREWSARGNSLVDPDGNVTTQRQLRAYWIVMQLCAELARQQGRTDEYYRALSA